MAVRVKTKPKVGVGIRWPGVSLGLVLALGLLVNRLSLWGNRLAQLKGKA